jgi:hypothetical protein
MCKHSRTRDMFRPPLSGCCPVSLLWSFEHFVISAAIKSSARCATMCCAVPAQPGIARWIDYNALDTLRRGSFQSSIAGKPYAANNMGDPLVECCRFFLYYQGWLLIAHTPSRLSSQSIEHDITQKITDDSGWPLNASVYDGRHT